MGNYTAGVRTICPFYVKESDKGITCEGIIPGTTQLIRFSSTLEKRRHQQCKCERRDYADVCAIAKLLTERAENEDDAVSVHNDAVSDFRYEERLIMLGLNIREARLMLGLTQSQLARLACLSRSYIGDIERGQKEPSFDTLTAIAKALNTTVGALLPWAKMEDKP